MPSEEICRGGMQSKQHKGRIKDDKVWPGKRRKRKKDGPTDKKANKKEKKRKGRSRSEERKKDWGREGGRTIRRATSFILTRGRILHILFGKGKGGDFIQDRDRKRGETPG